MASLTERLHLERYARSVSRACQWSGRAPFRSQLSSRARIVVTWIRSRALRSSALRLSTSARSSSVVHPSRSIVGVSISTSISCRRSFSWSSVLGVALLRQRRPVNPGRLLPAEAVEKGATLAAFLTDRPTAGAVLSFDQLVMRVDPAVRVSIRNETGGWSAHASCSLTVVRRSRLQKETG